MPLGLKHGEITHADHNPEWAALAAQAIERLWRILGAAAVDIQHVGSTAIKDIQAKSVIDIIAAAEDFDAVLALTPALEKAGFIFRGWEGEGEGRQPRFQCGGHVMTHYVHIVKANSRNWHNYINFRDYMNAFPDAAKAYEAQKWKAAEKGWLEYHAGKQDFVAAMIKTAGLWNDFDRAFIKIEPIDTGLSADEKYYVETANNQKCILRISDIKDHDRKKAAFERMKLMDAHHIPMSRPIDFGICNGNESVYQLLSWCDGENLESILPELAEAEQFAAGLQAGTILRHIHSVPMAQADIPTSSWNERYSAFIDESIGDFHKSGVKIDKAEYILDGFNNNRHLLKTRPQCYIHGDYHAGNLMLEPQGKLTVIDWEIHLFNSIGDPWKELSMQSTPHFSTGFIRGYFGGEPPEDFWRVFMLYTSISALSAIPWAYYRFPSELDACVKQCADVLSWFNDMKSPVPSWYHHPSI